MIGISLFSYLSRGVYPHDGPDVMCRPSTKETKHDPPLLFNLDYDPGELNPLNTKESPYKEILQTINEVGNIKVSRSFPAVVNMDFQYKSFNRI